MSVSLLPMKTTVVSSLLVCNNNVETVQVEADRQPGLPVITILGGGERVLNQARNRIRSALKNSGFTLPKGRVTLSLLPADLSKQGAGLDLALAVAILTVTRQVDQPPTQIIYIGEVSLAGRVNDPPYAEVILQEAATRKLPVVVPHSLVRHCRATPGLSYAPIKELSQLSSPLLWHTTPRLTRPAVLQVDRLKGITAAKRVALISLAGKHHAYFTGPAGVGKTALAEAMAEVLTRAIGSAAAYRAPHHSLSIRILLGRSGGHEGEFGKAAGGMLFLDEFNETKREVRESLRELLDVRSERTGIRTRPIVWAAQNPCPCGNYQDPNRSCRCSAAEVNRCLRKVSAPLKERFPLHYWVACPTVAEYSQEDELRSEVIVKHIQRSWQHTVSPQLSSAAEGLIREAQRHFLLSPRVVGNVQHVAATIASLADSGSIKESHVREALQYRPK